MENIYIISDVHGCYKTLLALIDQFPNKENSKICFVGDLVDKGKNSYDVVEFVKNNNYDCVLGNHESMFINCRPDWGFHGDGAYTLKTYPSIEDIKKHRLFLNTLPIFIEYNDYKTVDNRYLVISHSAIAKAWGNRDKEYWEEKFYFMQHLTTNRYERFDNKDIFNVYGHTPVNEVIMTEFDCNIDLGCVYNKGISNPRLCALEFPSMKIYTQESLEN